MIENHTIIKDVVGGSLEAERVHTFSDGEQELEFHVTDLKSKNFRCACGADLESEKEAIEHLNDKLR